MSSMGRRAWWGLAAAAVVAGACSADLPDDGAGDAPLAYTQRARLVDVTFVPFASTDLWLVGLAERPGDSHLYAIAQQGQIVRFDPPKPEQVTDGRLATVDFEVVLDLSDQVGAAGEEGLIGLAFDPAGEYAYVHYSRVTDFNSVIAEFAITPDGRFVSESERELFVVEQFAQAHNGGQLLFGPDGYLYLSFGDGSAVTDTARKALDYSSPLGKILRIDPRPSDDAPYTVPADNPAVEFNGADPRIWARGLRNPYSFSFDALTGDMWIADVGQGAWEEINYAPATDGRDAGKNLNFGWSAFEGPERFNPDQSPDDHTQPVLAYSHEVTDSCDAIIDGLMVRDSSIPALNGWYVHGNWCSGEIWAYDSIQRTAEPLLIESMPGFTDLVRMADGNLYVSATERDPSRKRTGRLALVMPQ
jgi:glucose/arabinose dehydrogenase